MALSAGSWSLEAGSGGAARAGGRPASGHRRPSGVCAFRAAVSSRLRAARGTSRKGRSEASRKNPADAHGTSVPGSPVNMGMLRAGLCPGLTQDVIQLLRSRGIKTVVDLVSADLEEVAQKCGLSYKVCLCVVANVAHGLQQNVLYIDSNGGLTASRILQLLQARTPDEEEQAGALQRIQVVHAYDIFQMLDVLQDFRGAVAQQVSDSSRTVKLVVVDSVTAVVSPLLGGQQREGLALMMQLAQELKTLARDLGVAVVVTNHMTRDRDSGKLKPALGRSWSFVPSTRIVLAFGEGAGAPGSQRTVCLTKSPRLPTGIQETVDTGTWGTPEQSPVLQEDQI